MSRNTGPESSVPPATSGGGGAGLRPAGADAGQGRESPYDPIARLYDPWSVSVTEDVEFYVEEARAVGGDVVELGVGTGRIAIPIAEAGIRVIGVDSSRGMLDVCAEQARAKGVERFLDLRLGDLRDPPVAERVPLVLCPFRSFLHLLTAEDRRRGLAAVFRLLVPGGRFVFDVFAPGADDIAETHGRWIEREPGISERAVWDVDERTLTLSVRGRAGESTMKLAWLHPREWSAQLREAGFRILECYGWFDRRLYAGGEDTVWIVERPE